MKTEKYRIDYVTGQIELNLEGDAYEFLCAFSQIGAAVDNRESTIIRKIEEWEN